MDISIMTVSIPVDADTLEEMEELLKEDQVDYMSLLSIEELTDSSLKGFCVLAYDDDADKLVGVLTAIDRLGTGDYEWSVFVSPSVRRHGIGTGLIQELNRNLTLRGAVYDLALVSEGSKAGEGMLEKLGYIYDFSERTMVAKAETHSEPTELSIRLYDSEQSELVEVLVSAFGDTVDEIINFIAFNTKTPNRRLMVAKSENELVGTVTIVEDSDKLWITGLGVHKDARGKGVATSILKWAKNEAHTLGKSSIYLDVETENETALYVYDKVGFETINLTHFYRRG